jgi:hypothetical protein
MSLFQKLAMAGAIAGALTVILRKAWAYERSSREEADIPTLHPVEDANPDQDEPLRQEDLRVAQNAPL